MPSDISSQLRDATERLIELESQVVVLETIGGIAHELNQPLNVTKIICQGIMHDIQKGRFSAEEAQKDLPEIVSQMNRLSEIVTHMQSLIRQKPKISLEPHDFNEVIARALKLITQQFKDHRVDVIYVPQTGLPWVMVDPARMERVVLNLMYMARYAVEKEPQGTHRIELKNFVRAEGKEVVFQVSFPGAGTPEREDPSEVFRLLACQRSVEAQQGRVEFDGGALLKVVFPAVLRQAAVQETSAVGGGRKMARILIVNDTPIINKFMKHSLESDGFVVDTVETGRQGIAKAKENPYDLFLLDYKLPDINGDVVCQAIKADAAIVQAPVYYISSLDKAEMDQIITRTGAQGFLDIAVDMDELCARIKALLGGSHA
ncbi:MAG: response regulator [Candidatus Omnitrophica bacterium]|nr:response regulator [Candidatus Omnitrophota bacterium]